MLHEWSRATSGVGSSSFALKIYFAETDNVFVYVIPLAAPDVEATGAMADKSEKTQTGAEGDRGRSATER